MMARRGGNHARSLEHDEAAALQMLDQPIGGDAPIPAVQRRGTISRKRSFVGGGQWQMAGSVW